MAIREPRFGWKALGACTMAMAAALGLAMDSSDRDALSHIARYCQTSWRNAGIAEQEWDDCTQQVLTELLESHRQGWATTSAADHSLPEHRELKRAVWRMIKRHQRRPRPQRLHDANSPRPVTSQVASRSGDASWDDVCAVAPECLTARQWKVLQMSRDGWSVGDIAEQLGIAAGRVSDAKYRALQKLKERLV